MGNGRFYIKSIIHLDRTRSEKMFSLQADYHFDILIDITTGAGSHHSTIPHPFDLGEKKT